MKKFIYGFAVLVVGFACAVLLACLQACVADVVPSGDTSACERYAARFGADECGVVYQFPIPAMTPSGFIEFCIPDRDGMLELAESMYGPSEPSPRFDVYTHGLVDPPCAYQCPSKMGCNAYRDPVRKLGGCFCPDGAL